MADEQDEEESPYFQNNAPAVKTVREPRQEQRPEPFATGQVEPPGPPGAAGPVIEQGGLPQGDERLRQQMLTSQQRQIFAQLPPAAQQHYALSQLELSRSESMQAQRLQNTLGAIEAHPGLTRGQKDDLIFQAKTKLNPMLVRQAKANEMKTQMQTQQIMQGMAQQATMQRANDKFNAQGAQDHVEPIKLSDGSVIDVQRTRNGELKAIEKPKSAAAAGEEKHAVAEQAEVDKDKKAHVTMLEKANDYADTKMEEDKKDPKSQWPDKEQLRQVFVNRFMERNQFKTDRDEHVQQEADKRAKARGSKTTTPATTPPPADGNAGQPPPPSKTPPPDEKAIGEAKPFNVDMTNRGGSGAKDDHPLYSIKTEDLSSDQRERVQALKDIRDKIGAKNWTERSRWGGQLGDTTAGDQLKAKHLKDVDDMAEVLGKFGSPARMEKEDPEQYKRWTAQLAYWKRLFPKQ